MWKEFFWQLYIFPIIQFAEFRGIKKNSAKLCSQKETFHIMLSYHLSGKAKDAKILLARRYF